MPTARELRPIDGEVPALHARAAGGGRLRRLLRLLTPWFTTGTSSRRSLDLGLEENVIWNALHSGALFKTTPYGGPTGNLVGEHAAYLSYVIAPFYAIHQSAETILVLQAVLIGGAAVPLYLVARKYLGPWLSCLVALWYLFYPPLHGVEPLRLPLPAAGAVLSLVHALLRARAADRC